MLAKIVQIARKNCIELVNNLPEQLIFYKFAVKKKMTSLG